MSRGRNQFQPRHSEPCFILLLWGGLRVRIRPSWGNVESPPSDGFVVVHFVVQNWQSPAKPCYASSQNGEGGIRTHGTVTRTTVFEFYDSHVGLCRSVAKRVLLFAISEPIILACDTQFRSVPRSWFAIWFANFLYRSRSATRQSGL